MTPIVWIFGSLMVTAIAAAFALTLKLAETKRRLQHVENDLSVALSEQAILNKKQDQEKANIKTMADTRINELTETIYNLQSELKAITNISHTDNLLDEPKITILRLLFKNDRQTIEQLTTTLKYDLQTTKFHLEDLKSKNMVEPKFARSHRGHPLTVWAIEQPGRRYLIENKKTS